MRSARVTLWLLPLANLLAVSPVTNFSTYLDSGGTLDQVHAVTLDGAGNVYVIGAAHRGTTAPATTSMSHKCSFACGNDCRLTCV